MLARTLPYLVRQLAPAWRPLSGFVQQASVDAEPSLPSEEAPHAAPPAQPEEPYIAPPADEAAQATGKAATAAAEKPSPIYMRRDPEAVAAANAGGSAPQGPIMMTRLKVNAPSAGPAVATPPRPPVLTSRAQQPLLGIRMEDASLPLPRFTPATRKMRPAPIDVLSGIEKAKADAQARFDETLEIAFNLGTDPRRGDHAVRGAATLPHGTGRSVRVGVFASEGAADLARAAGAEVVGGEELVADIQKAGGGKIPFDKCLATAEMMPKLARIARILGPRGLMPNPKLGTIVEPPGIADAVRTLKAGRVEFRADRTGVLHAPFGKCSFPTEHLYANLGALTAAVLAARPKGLKGGGMTGYIMKATLSSTMGRAVPVTIPSLQQAVIAAAAKRPVSF